MRKDQNNQINVKIFSIKDKTEKSTHTRLDLIRLATLSMSEVF